jgi:predicted component of type VI protein secretion system
MSDKNLSELLEELHEELAKTQAVDERGQELLRHLDGDIRKLLNETKQPQADAPMLERLQDTIDHFEDTHPRLTSALSHMLTILSNAGI